ncbi:MAG: DNA polymerase III subunit gamma/tau [Alphaproteobacteria bacterium]|nr:MAG: DNA polymerase III subunit gamma/tau [Alphaproteobacteria bacterium]
MDDQTGTQTTAGNQPYRVLARKYRPQTFSELIGQEAMVRTLSNAIASGRLAHAFILTGVRGIGKTTTARLIAMALNCIGADGTGDPTVDPCGKCEHCEAIAQSRHVDVMEMDAASRTGVDDIREIIDGVRYAPVSARFKVYIIDEVHMLSKSAFNALLKTLEEPPEHVKFIFATTEIRKVPVTVLSRCQRFDLKRVEAEKLVSHFAAIASKEEADIDEAALALIARAAEGSVRDGLSLLDQAIAHGAGKVTEEQVRDMLGLADRAQVMDLFRVVMSGKTAPALDLLRGQYNHGADPVMILQDMLEVVHWLTRLKVAPEAADDAMASEAERKLGQELARDLSMPVLTRSWQMLLKGLQEARMAPSPIAAAEMMIVRLAYSADLPSPADLVKKLSHGGRAGAPAGKRAPAQPAPPARPENSAPRAHQQHDSPQAASQAAPRASGGGQPECAPDPVETMQPETSHLPAPRNFEELVALFEDQREMRLAVHLSDHVHPVHFAPGRIDISLKDEAPPDLPHRVMKHLQEWTGQRWVVSLSSERGDASLREKELERIARLRREVEAHPLVREIQMVFPTATINDIRDIETLPDAVDPDDASPADDQD